MDLVIILAMVPRKLGMTRDDYDDNCNDVHNDKSEHDGNRLIKIF